MKDIPTAQVNQREVQAETSNNDLRIAFRYQDLPQIDSVQRGHQSGVTYDLNKKYPKEVIESYENIKFFSFKNLQEQNPKSPFECVIEDLHKVVKENSNNLLRICINSI